MLDFLEKLGLRRSIYLAFTAVLVAVAVAATALLTAAIREAQEEALRRRGETLTRLLGFELDHAVAAGDSALAQEALDRTFEGEEGAYYTWKADELDAAPTAAGAASTATRW